MLEKSLSHSASEDSYARSPIIIWIWLALIVIGFLSLWHFTENEKSRELERIEESLRVIAKAQSKAVDEFLHQQTKIIDSVGQNLSIQLYLSTLDDIPAASQDEARAASLTFMRNYIINLANQNQLYPINQAATKIDANISVMADRGVAIYNAAKRPLVSTPLYNNNLFEQIDSNHSSEINKMATHWHVIAQENSPQSKSEQFLVTHTPISAPQMVGDIAGYAVSYRAIENDLTTQLNKLELAKESAISILTYLPEDSNLSTLARSNEDEFRARNQPINDSTPDNFIVESQKNPKNLTITANDADKKMIAYSEPLSNGRMAITRYVDYQSAMKSLLTRNRLFLFFYAMSALALSLLVAYLWRYMLTSKLQNLLAHITHHEQLLKLIMDHMPMRLIITDSKSNIRYANEQVVKDSEIELTDLTRMSLKQIYGANEASKLEISSHEALQSKQEVEETIQEKDTQGVLTKALQRNFIPLTTLPQEDSYEATNDGVLIIEDDITELLQQSQMRQKMLNRLVESLVMMIDQRDPHAADQSQKLSFLSQKLAELMELTPKEQEAVATAGRLMNLGKLLISPDLLTQTKKLGDKQRKDISDSLHSTVEFLEPVPFDGPVIETLRQSREHVDGSGDLKMKDEEILPTAKILNLANSFIALTSDRSYRKALTTQEALAEINKTVGTQYQKNAVATLEHYLYTLDGKDELQDKFAK